MPNSPRRLLNLLSGPVLAAVVCLLIVVAMAESAVLAVGLGVGFGLGVGGYPRLQGDLTPLRLGAVVATALLGGLTSALITRFVVVSVGAGYPKWSAPIQAGGWGVGLGCAAVAALVVALSLRGLTFASAPSAPSSAPSASTPAAD